MDQRINGLMDGHSFIKSHYTFNSYHSLVPNPEKKGVLVVLPLLILQMHVYKWKQIFFKM